MSTSALTLNGGSIRDAVGNAAGLALASPGGINSLASQKNIVIDTTSPTVTYTSTNPVSPGASQTPAMAVSLSEAASNIRLYSNASCTTAISGSSSGVAGANSIVTSSLAANSTTSIFAQATDIAGNVSSCFAMTNYTHDGMAPTVTTVTSATANGTYGVGGSIQVSVLFSENVFVTGTPRMLMATGTGASYANYVSGSGTNTLSFSYIVAAGDNAAPLDYASISALGLAAGTSGMSREITPR
jgi:hypothetical protein